MNVVLLKWRSGGDKARDGRRIKAVSLPTRKRVLELHQVAVSDLRKPVPRSGVEATCCWGLWKSAKKGQRRGQAGVNVRQCLQVAARCVGEFSALLQLLH